MSRSLFPRNRRSLFPRTLPLLLTLPLFLGATPKKMEPGEEHRRLDFLVGEWDVEEKAYMGDRVHEAVNRLVIEWLPGGVWLEERSDLLDTPIGPMFGSARIAWDEENGEYVRHWIDNQSAVVLPQRGRFVDENTLEFSGSFEWIDGTTFHQRLVIVNDPAGGWTQTGQMGRDPAALKMNHEGIARPATTAKMRTIPSWLRNHMSFLARDGGRWITDNSGYRAEGEPFDGYGIEWRWGLGELSLTGRLFGLQDGEEQGTFWEFRTVWHPGLGQAMAYQFGASGVVGEGIIEHTGAGQTRMTQTFHGIDGSSFTVGHESEDAPDGTHITKSFDIQPDGSWKPRRTYVWRRAP